MRTLACAATLLVVVLPASRAYAQSPDLQALKRLLEQQRQLIERQSERLDALAREVGQMRMELDATRASLPAAAKGAPQTMEARLEALERTIERLPELPQKVVAAGEFPGSIAVPGTDAAFKIGGQVRFGMIHTLGPLGTDDRFIASSIPVDDQRAGEDSRTTYTAAPSRVNFDLRSPTALGAIRTFVEGDFAGSGNTARLRHAYIQASRWLFGQTWSTFSDPEVQPIDIDFEGENALSRFRQAQVRYTRPLVRRLDLSLAVENPSPDLTSAEGVNLTPDVVARVRWEPEDARTGLLGQPAHVQGAILVRTLRGELVGQADTTLTTGGFGGTLSGVMVPRWDADDRVKFAVYGGWGIGRYITDLSAVGGQDAVYDPLANDLRALPVSSVYVGYERRWRGKFLSAFTYGLVNVHNLDIQTEDSLRRTQRATANITWNPFARADLVFEFLAGERVNKDGESGASSQFQAGWRLRF